MGAWGVKQNWFGDNISCKLKNGSYIDFQRHKWLGSSLLKQLYLILFDSLQGSIIKVANVGLWINGKCFWSLNSLVGSSNIKESNTFWEELESIIIHLSLNPESADSFIWWRDNFGISVNQCTLLFYQTLFQNPVAMQSSSRLSITLDPKTYSQIYQCLRGDYFETDRKPEMIQRNVVYCLERTILYALFACGQVKVTPISSFHALCL